MSQKTSRIRLFSSRDELILLLVPAVFFPLLAIDLIFGLTDPARLNRQYLDFAMYFVFMDVMHVGLTYSMIARLPEFHAWREARGGAKRFRRNLTALFCALTAIIFAAGARGYFPPDNWRYLLSVTIGPILHVFPHFHTMWQNRGLSLAYNQKVRARGTLTDAEVRGLAKWERVERTTFVALYLSWLVLRLCRLSVDVELPFLADWVHYMPSLPNWAFGACMAAVLMVLWSAFRSPASASSFKLIYLLRLLLWPFTVNSYVALFAIAGSHGIEYFLVYRKMKESSALSDADKKALGLASLLSCSVICVLGAIPMFTEFTTPIIFIGSLSLAAAFTHYYLDRSMFQMRDPVNRATTGRLLLSDV